MTRFGSWAHELIVEWVTVLLCEQCCSLWFSFRDVNVILWLPWLRTWPFKWPSCKYTGPKFGHHYACRCPRTSAGIVMLVWHVFGLLKILNIFALMSWCYSKWLTRFREVPWHFRCYSGQNLLVGTRYKSLVGAIVLCLLCLLWYEYVIWCWNIEICRCVFLLSNV